VEDESSRCFFKRQELTCWRLSMTFTMNLIFEDTIAKIRSSASNPNNIIMEGPLVYVTEAA